MHPIIVYNFEEEKQGCVKTPSVGWGEEAFSPIDQILLLKEMVTENIVANSFAAWLTCDQLSCKFENIGGHNPPLPPSAHP